VNALLVANDIRVMELTPQRATLEEVFLNLLSEPEAVATGSPEAVDRAAD
jgi:hypothetical protein